MRTVWQEVIYRCDKEGCLNGESCYGMAELMIPGRPRKANKQAKLKGWILKKSGECYCPKCALLQEDREGKEGKT